MRGRLAVSALCALAFVLAGCVGGEDAADEEPRPATTAERSAREAPDRERDSRDGGGFLQVLDDAVAAVERESCLAEAAPAGGGSTPKPETVRAVAREVERVRRLRFRRLPRVLPLSRARLERRIRAELDRYPSRELADDTRALVALRAIPPGTDLERLLERLLPGQVAGYYDPARGELVISSDAERELDAIERLVLAHELEHALADQALGLPRLLELEGAVPDGEEDAQLAASALVEGDASLVDEVFAAEHLSLLDAVRGLAPALAALRGFADLPAFLQESLEFPYEDGLSFACALIERGGWRAIDRAYERPPTTSAQILFPARYFAREGPVDAPDPRPPGAGWRLREVQAFGAANLLWLFEAPGGERSRSLSDARERAAAWAGGELRVWERQGATVVGLALVERPGGRDLCASVRAWARAARVRGDIRCSGRVVRATLRP